MSSEEALYARLDELNIMIPNEPDVLERLQLIQERIDLRDIVADELLARLES